MYTEEEYKKKVLELHHVAQDWISNETEVRTETVHEATMLSGHTAVAWLKDISGCYSLDRVRAVVEQGKGSE